MDWVLTNALYELLICDAPIVVYNNDDKTDKGMHTSKEMKELTRKWEAKRKERRLKDKEYLLMIL